MSKKYFSLSLAGVLFVMSLQSSDIDMQFLQQKTLSCLQQGSLDEVQSLIWQIQTVQDCIHENYQLLDDQLQAVGFNYLQCQAFIQRFMTLNSEELVQDEAAPYNNNFLFEQEKQILFRGLKAKRIAQQYNLSQDNVERQVKSALDAYVEQSLMVAGSEQLRLFQANQNLWLQKFSLGNKSITLNSWKDTLELHKNRYAVSSPQISIVPIEVIQEQDQTVKATIDEQTMPISSTEELSAIQIKDAQSVTLLDSLDSAQDDAQQSVVIKISAKDREKEKKQKSKEAEQKKIQLKLQQQEAQRKADEAEKQRRELQRQKDLERQAQQKAADVHNKNNKFDTPQEKQKKQALAKKQAQFAAAQKGLQAKLAAEAEDNKLLKEALEQAEKDKDTIIENGRAYALSLAKKNGWRITGQDDTTKVIDKLDVGLSEEHTKMVQAYFNFINFPSIETLNDQLLDKIISTMPAMILTMRNVANDLSLQGKDLANQLFQADPAYFNNIAQVRLNWVSALQFFAHQYTNDVHAYDTMSHMMRKTIKEMAPEMVAPRMRLLKERQNKLILLDQQIKKIYCVIGMIDSLQDEGSILAKFTPDDINQRVTFMQNHIEKVLSLTDSPLSLKNEIDGIYPKLRELNAQAVSLSFSDKNIQDQQSILNLIVDVAYDFFEKNEFRAYGDYTKYKSTHKSELESSARTAYQDYIRSEEDILLFMSYQDKIVDQLLSLALNRNHELFVTECLKLKK